MGAQKPLIAHIVFRFDYGGLENGVVNLVNGLGADGRFRHAIIALTESTEFSRRVAGGVPIYALHKRPGKDPAAYLRLFQLLRRLKPTVTHTRNMGTLDCAFVAFLAGVPIRIHGEHGWDIFDPDGTVRKFRFLRRALGRFVKAWVTVSEDLRRWLVSVVGIPEARVSHICNGVDTERFRPGRSDEASPLPAEIFGAGTCVVGSVTRFSPIKDPLNLVDAFIRLRTNGGNESLRLLMIGDGEMLAAARSRLEQAGAAPAAWLPGSRSDIPLLLRYMDVFVLGSLREGVSNTILEAMASGLPVVATQTGGNVELVVSGETGTLVPPGDSAAVADAIAAYAGDPELRARHGRRARERTVAEFSIAAMLQRYGTLYERAVASQTVVEA